jgi:ATP-dependent Clp protease ATP-binding subunit ClpA
MFERFDPDAREVLVRAQAEAHRLHHGWVGCEHLLLALTTDRGQARRTLNSYGVTHSSVDRAIDTLVRRGVTDADALASIGIDLGEVRARVDEVFGPGALDGVVVTKRRWRLSRRSKRCGATRSARLVSAGQLPFTPRSKRCLEIAADTAAPDLVEVGHLAIAVMSRTDTLADEISQQLDVDVAKLRAQLERDARS